MIDVHMFAVGPIQENAYLMRSDAQATRALMIDPGEEPQRLLDAASALGVVIEAILITHCHFDHVGAVAPLARATGAPVYCPEVEVGVLADIMKWTMHGFGPFENWQAEHTVTGGEHLRLAGLDIKVVSTPGHSPGHVTYAISPVVADGDAGSSGGTVVAGARSAFDANSSAEALDGEFARSSSAGTADRELDRTTSAPILLSGDVLFEGSVGRVDLPGGDWSTLERSIDLLMGRYDRDTVVYPGHMGLTTLGREWDTNPFLSELRAAAKSPARSGS
jgi:hydroxyacylglutathione hydrolase